MTLFRINAGKYKHIVTFQRLSQTRDSYGQQKIWEDVLTIKAAILPISAREAMTVDFRSGEISHKIHIRYTKGIENNMRIVYGNRIFDIVSPPINYQEKGLELQLLCKERNPIPTGG